MRRGTYSIVARDPETGELGVAVQSHWFSVGSLVSWGEPGVGVVATQSIVDPSYGPRSLALLREAVSAPEALERLVAQDADADVRQVAVVDAEGRVAVHTGPRCIAHAGHETGEGFSCQANMMLNPTVWPAMAETFRVAEGSLTDRLLLALEAAEDEGGDVRGRQSAAILVVPPEGEPWQRSPGAARRGPSQPPARALAPGDPPSRLRAGRARGRPGRRGPDARRPRRSTSAPARWPRRATSCSSGPGLAAAQAGDLETAVARVRRALEVNPDWRTLLDRLEPEIAPGAPAVREALDSA